MNLDGYRMKLGQSDFIGQQHHRACRALMQLLYNERLPEFICTVFPNKRSQVQNRVIIIKECPPGWALVFPSLERAPFLGLATSLQSCDVLLAPPVPALLILWFCIGWGRH